MTSEVDKNTGESSFGEAQVFPFLTVLAEEHLGQVMAS